MVSGLNPDHMSGWALGSNILCGSHQKNCIYWWTLVSETNSSLVAQSWSWDNQVTDKDNNKEKKLKILQSFYVLYLPVLNEAGDLPEYRFFT